MAGLGEAEDHTPPAVAVDGRRSSVQSNGHSPAEMSVGMKKRRPASPEVVIPARPRTPSSNGNTSFEQSQSPTKKQRTEHKMFQLDMQLVDASMFTSRSAEGAIESMHTVPGSATIGRQR